MLKRINIKGYKSLVDLDVTIEPLTVLFGPNAAGKSNFLDALQLMSRIATSRTLKEAFEPPYRGAPLESFSFGDVGTKGLLLKESATFVFEADVKLSKLVVDSVNRQILEMKSSKTAEQDTSKLALVRERFLRYRIEIEILPKSGILRVADEYLVALNKEGEPNAARKPFISNEQGRLVLRMEKQGHPTYFEKGLNYSILSKATYAPHYPHLVAMQQELASWFFFYFEPRERMRMSNPVKEVRHIGLMGEDLASFLNTLQTLDPKQFKAVEKALHMIIPSVTGIEVGVSDLGEVELKLKEGITPIPARVLSEGTLRVLGLLAFGGAKEPAALIGFEEPENGIHPRRIRLVAELLKNRAADGDTQLIVTTHSPLLADLIPNTSLYVCRKEQGNTRIEPFSTWGPLGKKRDIDEALDAEEPLPVSSRIMRGDFDA